MELPVQTLSVSPVSYLCLVAHLCLTLCNPMDYSPPGFSVHGDSPGKNTGVGFHAILQGNLPNPGIEPSSPILQVDYFFFFFCVLAFIYLFFFTNNFQRRQWHPTPILLPGKSHGRRSLVGRLQSMGSRRVEHDCATSLSLFNFMH